MANTTNIIPNKLTMYQRVEGGVWHYRIRLKTGEWYRLSSRETDFDAAKEIANRTYYTADYKEKNRLPQTTRKFKNVAKYALTRLEDELDGGGGKVVYKDYIRTINNYLIPFFGKYDIANITIKLLSEYADWRDVQISLQKNRRKTTQIKKFRVSQSTINTHNSALNRVFDEAMLHGWITESIRPTLLNKGIKSESRGAFSEKEYKAIYTKLRTWWQEGYRQETRELRKVLREYVLFLGNTGIRHGTESIKLKWNNLEHYIDENKDKYLLINVDGKRGKREAVARTATTDYLMRLQAMNPDIAHMDFDTLIEKRVDDYIFKTESGKVVTADALRGSFKQLLKTLDLVYGADGKSRSLYSLRHMYATFALKAGRDIHKLALQMGTSVAMLEKFYSKVSPRMNAAEHAGIKNRRFE